jgi:hypothetical protein
MSFILLQSLQFLPPSSALVNARLEVRNFKLLLYYNQQLDSPDLVLLMQSILEESLHFKFVMMGIEMCVFFSFQTNVTIQISMQSSKAMADLEVSKADYAELAAKFQDAEVAFLSCHVDQFPSYIRTHFYWKALRDASLFTLLLLLLLL